MLAGMTGRPGVLAPHRRLSGGGSPPPAGFDYTITNDAQWGTIPGALLTGGGRIGVAPGNYTSKTITAAPSARLTFAATDVNNKPRIDRLIVNGASLLTVEDFGLDCSTWALNDATAAGLLLQGNVTAPIFRRCDFRGNYRGAWVANFDASPAAEYAELACLLPVFDGGGAVTSIEIARGYVGDLVADGTYPLTFVNSNVVFSVAPTAQMVVSGGRIVSATVLTGGASNGLPTTGQGIRSKCITWANQRRMNEWLPWGVRGASGSVLVSPVFEDCTFELVNNAIKPVTISGGFTAHGNVFCRVYQDNISIGLNAPNTPFAVDIRWNFGRLPMSASGDPGDPHSDFIQLFADDIASGGITTTDWTDGVVVGNVWQDGNARGSIQGFIIADMPDGVSFSRWKFIGNHVASKNQSLGLAISNPKDCYFKNNTFIRHDPTDAITNSAPVVMRVPGAQDVPPGYFARGRSFIGGNVVEALETFGWGSPELDLAREPNVVLGVRGTVTSYASVFADPATAARDTVAQIAAAYAPAGGYAGKGAFGAPSIVDHVNKLYQPANEPTHIRFADLTGQTLGATITSEWACVKGGVAGRAISIVGGEYRIANDAAGTGAGAWTNSAGTVDPNNFVQVRQTASASNGTTTTATLTIGGEAFGWNATTIATPFVAVDNGGTARSAVTGITNETGIRKLVLAFRAKPNSVVTNANIIAENAAASFRVWFASATAYRAAFFASNRAVLRPTLTPGTVAKTHLITLDLTNPNATQGCYWATAEDGLLLNNTPGSGGVFDTRSTAGSGTDYGAYAPSLVGTGALMGAGNSFGLFGEPDLGGITFPGQFEFFWMDWGGAGYVLPDITDSGIRSKWTSNQIGANGEGPTGAQPKAYFTGTAAEWNAGLANKGSLPWTLNKLAGTFT